MSKILEDVLKTINAAQEDREALIALANKYPDLDKQIAPRKDLAMLEARYNEADSKLKGWDEWGKANYNYSLGKTKAQIAAEERAVLLEAKMAEMGAGTYVPGGDMTLEQVQELMAKSGYVKKSDIESLGYTRREDLIKPDGSGLLDQRVNQNALTQEFFFTRTVNYPIKYSREFGEDFDMDGFLRFVVANGSRFMQPDPVTKQLPNLDPAYNEFVGGKRTAKRESELAAKEAALAAKESELEVRRTSPISPTDGGEGGAPPFQRMIQGTPNETDKKMPDVPLGSGAMGAQLYQKYKAGDFDELLKTRQ